MKLAIGLGLLLVAWGCDRAPTPPLRPNIILVIGDDHGWPYFGFMGDPVVETPHLDALASVSTWFPNGFVTASTCAPSLRTLLTGLHPIQWSAHRQRLRRAGVTVAERIRQFETLPRLLARNGYASFQGGKYWDGA